MVTTDPRVSRFRVRGYWGNIGVNKKRIMEKNMETTIVYWGHIGSRAAKNP